MKFFKELFVFILIYTCFIFAISFLQGCVTSSTKVDGTGLTHEGGFDASSIGKIEVNIYNNEGDANGE